MKSRILSEFSSKSFYKFILVGGFAATVNFFSRILFSNFFNFTNSVILAFVLGLTTAFTLNKIFVFKPVQSNSVKQFLYFFAINIVAVIQTILISTFFVYYLLPKMGVSHFKEEIAHFIGISIPIFSSFLGHKYITFAKSKSTMLDKINN